LGKICYSLSVGFINPGSLVDPLPNKGPAQQATLQTTHTSWAGPTTGRKGNPITDRKAGRGGTAPAFWLRPASPTGSPRFGQPTSGRPFRPEGFAQLHFRFRPEDLALVSSPPPDGLSDRKAWPNSTSGSDRKPSLRSPARLRTALRPESLADPLHTALLRLEPANRGRPLSKD